MKKKLISLCVASGLVLFALGCGSPQIHEPSGSLSWSLHNGVLTISGTGDLEPLMEGNGLPQWQSNADEITSVVIEDGITEIDGLAFALCTNIQEVTIPDSVTTIGDLAFEDCYSLTEIQIPESVTTICSDSFSGCDALENISVDENNPAYTSQDGVLYNKDMTEILTCPNAKTEYAFPDTVTAIGDKAFSACDALTSITIPDIVTTIGETAFLNCSGLTEITIPDGIDVISKESFAFCSSLTSVTIPSSVKTIEDSAFANCFALMDIYYAGSEDEWNEVSIGYNNQIGESTVIHYNGQGVGGTGSID